MKIAITGGCGFLGTNVALRLMSCGHAVVCVDDFSREGSRQNRITLEHAGVCVEEQDFPTYNYKKFDVVLHYAAQVTVTDSLADPFADFRTNLAKSMEMLENVGRDIETMPVFIFASTNKVYGLGDDAIISESFQTSYTSPYALSKGTTDRYFEMLGHYGFYKTIILRQSCLYGAYQWGIEGQGWLAWFLQKILKDETLAIFGDGQQVRDVLEVRDYARLITKIIEDPQLRVRAVGEIYNVGGGANNALSLVQAVDIISALTGVDPRLRYERGRLGDQQHFVCDIEKVSLAFGWQPNIAPKQGITHLIRWIQARDEGGGHA